MQWFDHSSTAASDDAIVALRMEYPDSAAVDCYWAIVEKQFHDERPVPFSETDKETKALAHRLCLGFEVLEKYVETMIEVGLLKRGENTVYSERAMAAVEKYVEKCEKARQNGKKGGRKPRQKPTKKPTAKRSLSDSQAINNNNTCIGFDKQNQIHDSAKSVAATVKTAPPSALNCDVCGAPMERTGIRVAGTDRHLWRCTLCAEEVSE